ncbi:MAG: hypothetical protein ABSD71_06050 [Bacteroidales bacterium]
MRIHHSYTWHFRYSGFLNSRLHLLSNSVLLFLLISSTFAFGQGYKVTANLTSHTILIGDQVDLSLGFSFPNGTQVIWPTIQDTILGNIQVIYRSKIDTSFSADKKTVQLTQKLKLTCFDSGFYTIPPIRFLYRNLPDTTIRSEQTEIQVLTVHTLAVDTTQAIKPIKGPVKIGFSLMDYLPWIIAGLLFFGIAGFLIFYYFKRKKGEPIFVLRPAVKYQPHELALMELEKLRVKKLWQAGKIKDYHTELTEIIRTYIEDRFHLMAMESTTGEILEDIENKTLVLKEYREILDKTLSMADLVKFAKYLPLPEEHEKSLDYAIDFINKTIPTPDFPLQNENGGSEGTVLKSDGSKLQNKPEPVTNNIN